MADEIQILADAAELQEFHAEQRPFWPNTPTECPVQECKALYHSFGSFQRHWNHKHLEKIRSYTCPCCNRKFYRKDYANRHLSKKHHLIATLISEEEDNKEYVDPKGEIPFRFNHRDHLRRKRQSIQSTDTLVTSAADCRDEEVLFDHNGNTIGKAYKRSKKQ